MGRYQHVNSFEAEDQDLQDLLNPLFEANDPAAVVAALQDYYGSDLVDSEYLFDNGFEVTTEEYWNEGDGRPAYVIFNVVLPNHGKKLVQLEGFYSSYGGAEYDRSTLKEVVKRKVITTAYVAADGSEDSQHEFAD